MFNFLKLHFLDIFYFREKINTIDLNIWRIEIKIYLILIFDFVNQFFNYFFFYFNLIFVINSWPIFSVKEVTFVFHNTQNLILSLFTYFNDSHTQVFTHTHTN